MGEAVTVEGRAVFALGSCEYTTDDILDSAWLAGKLEEGWSALLRGIASEEAAVERALQPDAAWLQGASEEFRYDRDLLTVEETERWLEDRQIGTRQFNDYFVRLYWSKHLENPPEVEPVPYHEAGANLRELLRVKVMLSGEFESLARFYAWRLLASGETQADPESIEAERTLLLKRTGLQEASLGAALERLGRDEAWLESQLSLQAAYQGVKQSIITRDRLERGLAQLRLPLTRVEFETVVLPSEDAAREAILCLRGNEFSVADLAAECGKEAGRHSLLLDDCPEDTQRRLICAIPGDVFGPDQLDDGFMIYRLVSKADPSLENAETRARLEGRLLELHFSERMLENIRWLIPGCA